MGLVKSFTESMNQSGRAEGYHFTDTSCGHSFAVWRHRLEWQTHIFYCPFEDCGAGYTLVFNAAGDLEGLEPFAG
jgi:hypothetical protein